MAPKRHSKVFEKVSSMFRRSSIDAPEKPSNMRHLDKAFFGEEEEEDEALTSGKREGTGLLDEEPDRAETDFYNGDKYVGDVATGKRHGHGVYYYDSGDKYTGNWNQGKQEGHGVYVYANGDRYVGEWMQGKHHGEGTYYFKSGKIFQGGYKTGSPCGHGVFLYTNGALRAPLLAACARKCTSPVPAPLSRRCRCTRGETPSALHDAMRCSRAQCVGLPPAHGAPPAPSMPPAPLCF